MPAPLRPGGPWKPRTMGKSGSQLRRYDKSSRLSSPSLVLRSGADSCSGRAPRDDSDRGDQGAFSVAITGWQNWISHFLRPCRVVPWRRDSARLPACRRVPVRRFPATGGADGRSEDDSTADLPVPQPGAIVFRRRRRPAPSGNRPLPSSHPTAIIGAGQPPALIPGPLPGGGGAGILTEGGQDFDNRG